MSETSPPAPPRRRRRGPRIVLFLVLGAALLWCGYWFASSQVVAMAFGRASESLGETGRDIGCGRNAAGGFPLSLDLDCAGVTFSDRKAGVAVTLASASATAPLYRPGAVTATAAGPLTVDAPGLGLSLAASWAKAAAEADAGFDGLNGGTLRIDGLAVEPLGGRNRLPFRKLSAAHAAVWAIPLPAGDYRLAFDTAEVTVAPRKGKRLPPLAVSLDLVARDFGGSLGADPRRAIAAWLAGGGGLEIERLAVEMGESAAVARGSLTVSPEGLVSGDLVVRFAGLDRIPALAERLKLSSRKNVRKALAMASAFTRPAADDPAAREAPVAIRNGVVLVGMIPVATIPPVRF